MKQVPSDKLKITEKEHKFLQLFIHDPHLKFSKQVQMLNKLRSLYPEYNFNTAYVQRKCTKFKVIKPQDSPYYQLDEEYTQLARAKKISDTLADIDFNSLDITFNVDYIILKPKDPWSLAKLSYHLINSLDFNDNIIDILTLNTSLLVFCRDKQKLHNQLNELASVTF